MAKRINKHELAEAFAYFGLGSPDLADAVFVTADVRLTNTPLIYCEVYRGKRRLECEFIRSQVGIEWESFDIALLQIPRSFVSIFRLANFVLDSDELERHKRNVELWNAPFMPHKAHSRPAVERIAGIRIN